MLFLSLEKNIRHLLRRTDIAIECAAKYGKRMSTQTRQDAHPDLGGFLGVAARTESYVRLVYLLISFPLGVFYFCLILVWFCLGIGLSFIVIGIPILGLMFLAARALAGFERQLANVLLNAGIAPGRQLEDAWSHPWRSLKACLTDSFTWKGLVFLLLKFPFGLVSFIVSVVLVSLSIGLILTPLLYRHTAITFFDWRVVSPEGAFASLLAGLVIGILTLHVTNLLAALWRGLGGFMLASAHPAPVASAKSGPIVIP